MDRERGGTTGNVSPAPVPLNQQAESKDMDSQDHQMTVDEWIGPKREDLIDHLKETWPGRQPFDYTEVAIIAVVGGDDNGLPWTFTCCLVPTTNVPKSGREAFAEELECAAKALRDTEGD